MDSTRVTVSRAGGRNPLWAHSGSELFFVDGEGGFVAAEVEADSVFRVLRNQTLFTVEGEYVLISGSDYHDIGPDDERFEIGQIPLFPALTSAHERSTHI